MSNALLVPPPHQGPPIPYEDLLDNARASLPEHLPTKAKDIVLALDVDGTLLLPGGASPRVKRSVRSALEAGINFVVATGRGISSTRPVFTELDLPDGYSVSTNGAQLLHWSRHSDGHVPEILAEHRFEPEQIANTLVEAMPGILLGVDHGPDGMLVTDAFPENEMLAEQIICSLPEMVSKPIVRMIARFPTMDRDEFESRLRALSLEGVNYAVGWTAWADLCLEGVNKATGLQDLIDQLGLDRSGVVALGDGTNDIEMLQWAGHGVAMGGASRAVVAAADATTGPVDFDGSAAVIDAILERI